MMAPAEFVAGWYDGFTQQERSDITACYKPDSSITDTLYNAMDAYNKGDLDTGEELVIATEQLCFAALTSCP